MGKLIVPKMLVYGQWKIVQWHNVILVYALKIFTLNALVYETVNCLLQH